MYKPWLPLSLLAAAVYLERDGCRVTIIDQRTDGRWQETLREALRSNPVCVGVTAMTGTQIISALEASRIVKAVSAVPVVWGGVHATLFPEQTVADANIDVVVMGEGERTFDELVGRFESAGPLDDVPGICFKREGRIVRTPDRPFVHLDDLPEIPYGLVDLAAYRHRYFGEEHVIEVESSRGCPYACTFCYNPLYSRRTWRAFSARRVVESLRRLHEEHAVCCFQFIDDCFFIDRERTREIMTGIVDAGLKIRLGFQGVRVDTFRSLSDGDLELLHAAGGRFLQFGVESGSPRILELINKRISVDDVVAVNRRLAGYPAIIPLYNFMCGFPTETRSDLLQSTALAWRLLSENPSCMISPFHHYKPYPGTALRELLLDKIGVTPTTLEGWGRFDWTKAIDLGHGKKLAKLMLRVEMVSILVDRKLESQTNSLFWARAANLYRPVARLRLKHDFYALMPEYHLMRLARGE